MSPMWFYKHKILVGIALPLLAFWYVVFELDWITYTGGNPSEKKCYSPNHEYYLVRLQTPFNALVEDSVAVRGTAKLYDKTGKFLYTEKTSLSYQAGPTWGEGFAQQGEKSFVSFTGNFSPDDVWRFELPASPGKMTPLRVCY